MNFGDILAGHTRIISDILHCKIAASIIIVDVITYNPSNLVIDLMAFRSLVTTRRLEILDRIAVKIAAVVVTYEGVILRVRHTVTTTRCLHLGVFLSKGGGY